VKVLRLKRIRLQLLRKFVDGVDPLQLRLLMELLLVQIRIQILIGVIQILILILMMQILIQIRMTQILIQILITQILIQILVVQVLIQILVVLLVILIQILILPTELPLALARWTRGPTGGRNGTCLLADNFPAGNAYTTVSTWSCEE
jgi:hypothetical protein